MSIRIEMDVVDVNDLLAQLLQQENFSTVCLALERQANERYLFIKAMEDTQEQFDGLVEGMTDEQWALIATRLRELEQELAHMHDDDIPY